MTRSHVRLRDVAVSAGVSVRTVSNVVNGYAHVAPATRARVQRVLDELGYRPNLAARQLRQGRTGMIGVVVPEIASPYFSELAAALVSTATARGWTVLVDETGGDAERERLLLGGSGARLVDGLILSPWALDPRTVERPAIPVVLLGEQSAPGVLDHVAVDNVAAAAQATAHLISLGRRRIAAIGLQPHLTNGTAALRQRGYRQALADAGLPLDPALEVPVPTLHRAAGYAGAKAVAGRRPDALFCFTDELALGAMRALAEAGVRVPQDVAVIGFDDIEDGRYSAPSLSTVAPAKDEIARVALDRLLLRIAEPGTPVVAVVARHRLEPRESTLGR
jgi:DNA-binding LacI/PurR family transcriptional regulator